VRERAPESRRVNDLARDRRSNYRHVPVRNPSSAYEARCAESAPGCPISSLTKLIREKDRRGCSPGGPSVSQNLPLLNQAEGPSCGVRFFFKPRTKGVNSLVHFSTGALPQKVNC